MDPTVASLPSSLSVVTKLIMQSSIENIPNNLIKIINISFIYDHRTNNQSIHWVYFHYFCRTLPPNPCVMNTSNITLATLTDVAKNQWFRLSVHFQNDINVLTEFFPWVRSSSLAENWQNNSWRNKQYFCGFSVG